MAYKNVYILFKGGENALLAQGEPMFDEEAGVLIISGGEDATTVITANFDNINYYSVSPIRDDEDADEHTECGHAQL